MNLMAKWKWSDLWYSSGFIERRWIGVILMALISNSFQKKLRSADSQFTATRVRRGSAGNRQRLRCWALSSNVAVRAASDSTGYERPSAAQSWERHLLSSLCSASNSTCFTPHCPSILKPLDETDRNPFVNNFLEIVSWKNRPPTFV